MGWHLDSASATTSHTSSTPGQRKRHDISHKFDTRTAQAPPPPIIHTPVPCIIEAGREEQVYLKRKEYAEHNRGGESVLSLEP